MHFSKYTLEKYTFRKYTIGKYVYGCISNTRILGENTPTPSDIYSYRWVTKGSWKAK